MAFVGPHEVDELDRRVRPVLGKKIDRVVSLRQKDSVRPEDVLKKSVVILACPHWQLRAV